MPELRKGDTVTLTAVVTDVAPYDEGQQICCQLLPNGKSLGWLIQKETEFVAAELKLAVGDRVTFKDRVGYYDKWEIKAIFDNNQIAVQKVGNWPVEMADARKAVRV